MKWVFLIGLIVSLAAVFCISISIKRRKRWLEEEHDPDEKMRLKESTYVESPEEREARLKHEALVEKFYYELGTEEEKKEWEERKKREAEEAKEQERHKKESMFGKYIVPYSVCSVADRFMSGIYTCRI